LVSSLLKKKLWMKLVDAICELVSSLLKKKLWMKLVDAICELVSSLLKEIMDEVSGCCVKWFQVC
jgi:hypothetical protein